MANMNRLGNVSNRFQGKYKKVLCVCSAGLLRSPTIAYVLSGDPYNCNVRAAGIYTEYALVPVDEVLLSWADEVVCAEYDHANMVREMLEKYSIAVPVTVLEVPDRFSFRQPELQTAICKSLTKLNFKGTPKE
jgi:predicted protein tyrosine phosphatase